MVARWLKAMLSDPDARSEPDMLEVLGVQAIMMTAVRSRSGTGGRSANAARVPLQGTSSRASEMTRLEFSHGVMNILGLRTPSTRWSHSSAAMSIVFQTPGAYYIDTGNHAIGIITSRPQGHPAYYFIHPNSGVYATMNRADVFDVPALIERNFWDRSRYPLYNTNWAIHRVTL
jgi:hypothetical protein